jgi:hypothetical protein
MRRFAKAGEQAQIPEFIDKKFFGNHESSVLNDPYAKLRRNAHNNQEKIASATATYDRDRTNTVPDQPWARVASAETYTERRRDWNEGGDNLGSLTPMDLSGRAVRRASYDTDDVHNRSRDLKEILNENNCANYLHLKGRDSEYDDAQGGARAEMARAAFGRHASIFGVTLDDVADACSDAMEQHLQRFDRKTSLEKRQGRRAEWEQEQMTKLASARRPDVVSSAAAYRLTDVEYSDSAFNLLDHAAIARADADRLRIQNERRAQSLSIKRFGKSPKERRRESHSTWEQEKMNEHQRSYQGHSSTWLDRHVDGMIARG